MKNKPTLVFVSCWYQGQIYSQYTWELQNRLRLISNFEIRNLTSECACGATRQLKRENLFNAECKMISTSFTHYGNLKPWWLGRLAGKLEIWKAYHRGQEFARVAGDAEIIHFQQVTDAFGSLPLFGFLRQRTTGKKIVTVHELDAFQLRYCYLNRLYNRADKVIVHSEFIRHRLSKLGVADDKMVVMPFGKNIPQFDSRMPEHLIFYGGHHLFSGKGFHEFVDGLKLLADQDELIPVKIFGGYSLAEELEAQRLVREKGLVRWIEFLHNQNEQLIDDLYQSSRLAVIPFTSGSGAQAVTMALMNGTPVLASRATDLPEYADGCAYYLKEVSANTIAVAIRHCLQSGLNLSRDQIKQYAHQRFAWEVIASKTVQIYHEVLD